MNDPAENKPDGDSTATLSRTFVFRGGKEDEVKFQAHQRARIEALDRSLSNPVADNTRPDFMRKVEDKQRLERELEISQARVILVDVSEAMAKARPAECRTQIKRIVRFLDRPHCDQSTPHAQKLIEAQQRLETKISEIEAAQEIRESTSPGAIVTAERSVIELATVNADPSENSPAIAEVSKAPQEAQRARGVANRRERGPDVEKHRERVELEDALISELGAVQQHIRDAGAAANLDALRNRFAGYKLWSLLSEAEQQELVEAEFKPKAYARTLTARNSGVQVETIKKSRQLVKNSDRSNEGR